MWWLLQVVEAVHSQSSPDRQAWSSSLVGKGALRDGLKLHLGNLHTAFSGLRVYIRQFYNSMVEIMGC